MKALSPLYALQLEAGALTLKLRADDQMLFDCQLRVDGGGVHVPGPIDILDGEALRLLIQALFHTPQIGALRFDVPQAPQALQSLVAVGARMGSEGMRLARADFDAANRALACKGQAWLERDLPTLSVACIALIDAQDQVLLAQRPVGKSFAGLWEFPGGKLEAGESPELALCREIGEELGIQIWNSCLSPLTFVSHAYADFHLTMLAYACYKFEGNPQGREGQALKWWPVRDMNPDLMPPANAPIVHALQDLLG